MNEALELSSPVIRPYRESDRDFVEASWMDSYWHGCVKYICPYIERIAYFKGQRRLIRQLLSKPWIKIVVAVSPEYDEAILGWMISEGNAVHYAYTKESFRKMGIAAQLLKASGIETKDLSFTHVTKVARAILAKHPHAAHDPWAIFRE